MDITELNRIKSFASIKRHPWELARRRIIFSFLKKIKASYNVIVDFGSGDTFLLHHLENKNIAKRYYAIDNAYSPGIVNAIKYYYEPSKIEYVQNINEVHKGELPADCLLLLDVIEHCEDDSEILRATTAEKVLAKNATVIITVPAYQFIYSQHDRLLKHYRRYSLNKLVRLCEQSGLRVTSKGYFFFSLLCVRLFQLLLEKGGLQKSSKSLDNWNSNKTITKTITALLWVDFKIGVFLSKSGLRVPGLSCYCICTK